MSARDAIHEQLLTGANPAAMKRYLVTIIFADGQRKARVSAANEQRAYDLALIDARMGSPGATFASKVIGYTAEPVELERMQV